MIFTLIGADFSKSNIGTISSWMILRELGAGATYSGPSFVEKNSSFTATVTLAEKYEISSIGIILTMNGITLDESYYSINDNIITFNIPEVTGSVVIKVPTLNTETGEEDAIPTYTITYEYKCNGVTIKEATIETVKMGTVKNFTTDNAPEIEGYIINSVDPESITVNNDIIVTYIYKGEAYWIGEKLSGKAHGTGEAASYLGTQYYYITDEAAISELSGKAVDKMAFNFASKSGADTPTGTITVYLVNSNNSAPSNWEAKAEITVEAYPAGSQKEFDITPFTVPAGYTIGYCASKGNILGGGYMMQDYKIGGAYYDNVDATSSKDAQLGGVDVHVQKV